MSPRKRFSYANVMSTLALFVAVTGGGVAIASVPNNSVTSNKIVDETIKHQDIKDGLGVRGAEVVDGTLGSVDVLDDSLTASDLGTGSVGVTEIAADAVGSSEIAVGAVATAEIATDAVGTSQIATNAVGSDEIATDAIGSSELNEPSVSGNHIVTGAVGSAQIEDGAIEAAEIADGIENSIGTSTLVAGGSANNAAYNTGIATAACATGDELISGSAHWNLNQAGEELFISEITLDHFNESVTVTGGNDSGIDRSLFAVAVCLTA
jgi:hypothetical protein